MENNKAYQQWFYNDFATSEDQCKFPKSDNDRVTVAGLYESGYRPP